MSFEWFKRLITTLHVSWAKDLGLQCRVFHRGFGTSLRLDLCKLLLSKNEGADTSHCIKHLSCIPHDHSGTKAKNSIIEVLTPTQPKLLVILLTSPIRFSAISSVSGSPFAKKSLGPYEPRVLRTTFSRIICGDVCKPLDVEVEFRRSKEAEFPKKDMWDRLKEGDLYATDQRTYGWGLYFGFTGRFFFTTTSGKMGLCHPNTRTGDETWILSGIRAPFFLHPIDVAEERFASRQSFLGDFFLQGIMDGELGGKEKPMERPIVII